MLISFSISSGLEFRPVNHSLIYENSELSVFKIKNFYEKHLVTDEMIY